MHNTYDARRPEVRTSLNELSFMEPPALCINDGAVYRPASRLPPHPSPPPSSYPPARGPLAPSRPPLDDGVVCAVNKSLNGAGHAMLEAAPAGTSPRTRRSGVLQCPFLRSLPVETRGSSPPRGGERGIFCSTFQKRRLRGGSASWGSNLLSFRGLRCKWGRRGAEQRTSTIYRV